MSRVHDSGMMILPRFFYVGLLLGFLAQCPAFAFTETIMQDYGRFYARERFGRIGVGLGVGMILANTDIDRQIHRWYQHDVRRPRTDAVSRSAKLFGEGKYVIPLSILLAGFTYVDHNSPVGAWGASSARAYLTGGPAMLLLQRATGGSRPEETGHDSRWRPFQDDNGVSGHAFMGAVPFLTLGKMLRGNTLLQYSAYAASTATAWSRINDNTHYLSQAVLGWYLAWEAVDAVFHADEPQKNITIAPLISQNGYGVAIRVTW